MNSTSRYRIVAAGIIGNVLEWYDFAIYGYFAAAIGRHFFPHQDPVAWPDTVPKLDIRYSKRMPV